MTEATTPAVPAHWPSEAALIADLKATYLGIVARPIAEFGYRPCQHGVWTGGEAVMPDGLQIFCDISTADPEQYDGHVHRAFVQWLDQRGWLIEAHDSDVFFIRSKAEDDDFLAADLAFSDLLDQEREAHIVLHRLQAEIAEETARRLDTYGKGPEAEEKRAEATQHLTKLTELMSERRAMWSRSDPDSGVPF